MRFALVLLLSLVPLTVLAQQEMKKPPGVKVGEKAPEFALKDQLGKVIKLSEMRKDGPVALVFHRSASW